MYSNDQTQIRMGMVNFIGSLIASSKFQDKDAVKHSVVAILLEEAAKLCKDEDGYYKMYSCKPILRLTAGIAKQRKGVLEGAPGTPDVIKQKESYDIILREIESLLENIKL